LKEQLARLIELQKIESVAGKIHAKRKHLPVQIKMLEQEFNSLCEAVETQREQMESVRKHRQEKDAQLQTGQQTLKRTRERLFEVKNNKEYQSMLKEIEIFESKNSKMEDEVITLLDELEHLETAMKVSEEELKVKRQRFEEEKKKIENEMNALIGELDGCIRKSEEIRHEIPAEILRKYEQIKGVGRGVAVVAAWKEVCCGCHMSLPPQLYNELQKTTALMTCPNCSRIIYWENRNG
jgi:predicted  nucleic acid-binding Zn-ribbon protein